MRIIAGSLGGRQIASPKGHRTHPMGDRVRTALFNTLGDIAGLTVLDAFGGSGALGLEAMSRGASRATILEVERAAYDVIVENVRALKLTESVNVQHINARSWSYRNNTLRFDLVLCDPPYDQLQETTLEKMAKHTLVGGLIVFSLPPHADIRLSREKFTLLVHKTYGDATLAFYRRIR